MACRSKDVTDIRSEQVANPKSSSDKVALIVEDLQRRGAAKPQTRKTLSSTINSLFQKQLPDEELASLLNELEKQGVVTLNDTKVSYAFPT
jgi:hypothetical protein